MVDLIKIPETLKQQFIETAGGFDFKDETHVTSEDVWRFLTVDGPRRFPYAYDPSPNYASRISEDFEFFSGLKQTYLSLTLRDRLFAAHAKGTPIVLVQGGQGLEPYFAANSIPLRPGYIMEWACATKDGLNLKQLDARMVEILEEGRRRISIEACDQVAAHVADDVVPIDLIAPYLCLRCSDMAYLVEAHRRRAKIPTYLVDYPVENQGKEWAVEYLAKSLHGLTDKISQITKKPVTDSDLSQTIKAANKVRKITREYYDIWLGAKVPPTNSRDHYSTPYVANDVIGDPIAGRQLLEGKLQETKDRVKHSVKGKGLVDDPARIFVVGSCVDPSPHIIDRAGGVLVGRDDNWSTVSVDVQEEGDPYENLARTILSYPYEQPTEKRAEWIADQVKKARADGVVVMYNWGCNFQTAVARIIEETVKAKTGVPTTYVESAELGRAEMPEQVNTRVTAFIEMLK
jgi:benzoyl-CoA reductase/2-hydroxyglutaryl-CoA dehydratase subunit BcrC/BadD/HgdB